MIGEVEDEETEKVELMDKARMGVAKILLLAVVVLCLSFFGFKSLAIREARNSLLVERNELLQENRSLSERIKTGGWVNYKSNGGWLTRTEGFAAAVGSEDVDVVFLGDSLVENWQTELAFPLISCMNQGISGDVTEGILNRLDLVEAFSPRVVVLEIGTNDLGRIGDVEGTARNMRAIVDYLRGGALKK